MSAENDPHEGQANEMSIGSDLAKGVVIVEYASPVTWAAMEPLHAVQVARLLDKHAARVLANKGKSGVEFDVVRPRSVEAGTPPPHGEPVSEPVRDLPHKKRSRGKTGPPHDADPG